MRRDPVSLLEPPGLLTRTLGVLELRTVGDLLKLDLASIDGHAGIGAKRHELLAELKGLAARHLESARCAALPVTLTAPYNQDLKRFHRALLKEELSPADRLQRLVEEVARLGAALPTGGRRPGRRPSWRITFSDPEGPEVDLDATLRDLVEVGLEELDGQRVARLRVAQMFCERWNGFAERPKCYLGGESEAPTR